MSEHEVIGSGRDAYEVSCDDYVIRKSTPTPTGDYGYPEVDSDGTFYDRFFDPQHTVVFRIAVDSEVKAETQSPISQTI